MVVLDLVYGIVGWLRTKVLKGSGEKDNKEMMEVMIMW